MLRGDITEQVRLLADDYGVSERTAWRWLKTMRAKGSPELLKQKAYADHCEACGHELPASATIRRRFCDGTCRQAHRRRRLHQQRLAAARRAALRGNR